ncbi:beta-carotene hydroxylase [Micromonas pusilla CCMP1545]|uniref:beta-carotene 3-hydroxylase n=1 Tax=Micromonas pusilla (strain CCMP1545) TaxID=564608 RepID=C1MI32_MICPC|nr:beta-carotene hydroxylase [Micromonas pusilla CCMP1545]EEH60848.1 beta-carotene hydroxylase [Micromonas pusilla CCMP1545]|eukprot:XP_003055596.1 beta-carotene hydroxylase [Micromonas pusilla CCMP1545]
MTTATRACGAPCAARAGVAPRTRAQCAFSRETSARATGVGGWSNGARNARASAVRCVARSKPQNGGVAESAAAAGAVRAGAGKPQLTTARSAIADTNRSVNASQDDSSSNFREPSVTPIAEKKPRRKALTKGEREAQGESYEWAAWVSTCGITSIAITATYLRLLREVTDSGAFPWSELIAQVALIAGAAVGMEFYARFAHKHLWHDSWWTMPQSWRADWNRPIWLLHESHHLPREGAFEANDIFAVSNGVPAFALCAYGFVTPGVFGGLCFGAGLGITLFGIAYMYVHDGMVHKRFPTGPLGKNKYLRQIAAGHTIHHTEKFDGVPWGLFLATQELSAVPGGMEELATVLEAADRKAAREEEEARALAAMGGSVDEGCEEGDICIADQPILRVAEHIPSQNEAPACVLPPKSR